MRNIKKRGATKAALLLVVALCCANSVLASNTGLSKDERVDAVEGVEGFGEVESVESVDGAESLDATEVGDTVVEGGLLLSGLHAVGRYKNGEVWLRWAPEVPKLWEAMLKKGVVIEKVVYTGKDDDTSYNRSYFALPPKSPADSVQIASHSDNTWISAMGELMFADSLEVGIGGRLRSLSQKIEAEQTRLSLALMISDLSYQAACIGKMGMKDTAVERDKTYLYRIYIPGMASDTAVVYVRPEKGILIPPLEILEAKFRNRSVELSWEGRFWSEICVGYNVEKAVGNGPFEVCNKQLITVLHKDYQKQSKLHYTDSLALNGKVFKYRITGVDLFGDTYIVSNEIKGMGEESANDIPNIIEAKATVNGGCTVTWSYPKEKENLIEKFTLYVKNSMYDEYRAVGSYDKKQRKAILLPTQIGPSSYFSIAVYGKKQEVYFSPVYFFQSKDTIAPQMPTNLIAMSDSGGEVKLLWSPSSSKDVEGYYIYKAMNKGGEAVQINAKLCNDTIFRDSICLLFWKPVYYHVRAVDFIGNTSESSNTVDVVQPNPNPLFPALFENCEYDDKEVRLSWTSSKDEDVKGYKLYLKVDESEWTMLKDFPLNSSKKAKQLASTDDTENGNKFTYAFPSERNIQTAYSFRLSVYSDRGEEVYSPSDYIVEQKVQMPKPRIQVYPLREKRCIVIQWSRAQYSNVSKAYIYRKVEGQKMELCRVITKDEWTKEMYIDANVKMNTQYQYSMQIETDDKTYSRFSEPTALSY